MLGTGQDKVNVLKDDHVIGSVTLARIMREMQEIDHGQAKAQEPPS